MRSSALRTGLAVAIAALALFFPRPSQARPLDLQLALTNVSSEVLPCWVFVPAPKGAKADRKLAKIVIGGQLFGQSGPGGIKPGDNPLTQASGTIWVGPFTDCPCKFHFHGTLVVAGVPFTDSGEKCGWGCLIPKGGGFAPPAVEDISDAFMDELCALKVALLDAEPDYSLAKSKITSSAAALASAADDISEGASGGDIPEKQARKMLRKIAKIAKADIKICAALQKLIDGDGGRKELKAVQKGISSTLKQKQKLLKVIDKLGVIDSEGEVC